MPNKPFLIIYLLCVCFISCNKDSNELPDLELPNIEKASANFSINNSEILFVKVERNSSSLDTISFVISNITDDQLTDLHLYIELCDSSNFNYGKCFFTKEITVDTIEANKFRIIKFFNTNNNKIDDVNINGGIVKTTINGTVVSNIVSGVYEGLVNYEKANDTILQTNKLDGYILADGTTNFRLKYNVNAYRNIRGELIDTISFFGNLYDANNTILAKIELDTLLLNSTNNTLNLKYSLQNIGTDSIKYLHLNVD